MTDLVWKSKLFAMEKHKDQVDDEGFPYFDAHIQQVVNILMQVTNEGDVIAAAYLHDIIEDTNTTYEELCNEFDERIANLVMEVTHEGCADSKGFYFPRLKSQKAILIKFADRLSNLSRMERWDRKRKEQYLRKSKFWRHE